MRCVVCYYPNARSRTDFQEERRTLLEVIGPELQSIYDDRQIEVSCADASYGMFGDCIDAFDEILKPFAAALASDRVR